MAYDPAKALQDVRAAQAAEQAEWDALRKTTSGYIPKGGTGANWLLAAQERDKALAALADAVAALTPDPPPPPPPPPSGKLFGFATGWGPNTPSDLTAAELDRYMATIASIKPGLAVRMDYSSVGSSAYKRARDVAVAHGLEAIPIAKCNSSTTDVGYAALIDDILARYPDVKTVELGNEMNGAWSWGTTPNPERYVQLAKVAYPRLKTHGVLVISGGLAQYTVTDAGHMNSMTYFQRMKAAGIEQACDAIGWHPYGDGSDGWGLNPQIAALFPGKPLILTETGIATAGGGFTGVLRRILARLKRTLKTGRFFGAAASEAQQAQILTARMNSVKTASYIGGITWYSFLDHNTATGASKEDHFGIVHRDWSPKPAFAAYHAAVN